MTDFCWTRTKYVDDDDDDENDDDVTPQRLKDFLPQIHSQLEVFRSCYYHINPSSVMQRFGMKYALR